MTNPQDLLNGLMSDDMEGGAADQRKQALAMLLLKQLQQNQPSVQAPPGGYNAPGILGKLPLSAVLMNAGAQGLAQSDIASAGASLDARKQRTQQDFLTGMQGLNDAPDKDAAIAKLMTSQNPMLRQMAEAQAKIRREQAEKEAERNRQLREAAARAFVEKGDTQGALQVLAEGAKVDPTRVPPPAPAPVVGSTPGPDGKPRITVTNTDPKSGAQKLSLETGTNVTVNQGVQKAGAEKVAGLAVESLAERKAGAEAAVKLGDSLNRLESYSQDGVVTGPAAQPMMFITGLLKSAGLPVDGAKLARSEAFDSMAQEAVQALIQQMPRGNAGITKEEAARIQLIMPSLKQSPEARAELVEILRGANRRTIEAFRQSATGVSQMVETGNFGNLADLLIPPAAMTPLTPNSISPVKPPSVPAPAPLSRGEAGLRAQAALSPAEQARSDARERSPQNLKELELAIAKEPDPKKREILLQEYKKLSTAPAQNSGWRIVK